MILCQCIGF